MTADALAAIPERDLRDALSFAGTAAASLAPGEAPTSASSKLAAMRSEPKTSEID
jgi:hypothetical protein